METLSLSLSIVSVILSLVAIFLSDNKSIDRKIEQAVDLAERAGSLNSKNGNKLTSLDKKRIAFEHAKKSIRRKKDNDIACMIEAEVERRKRNA